MSKFEDIEGESGGDATEMEEGGIDQGAIRKEYFRIVIPDLLMKSNLLRGKCRVSLGVKHFVYLVAWGNNMIGLQNLNIM